MRKILISVLFAALTVAGCGGGGSSNLSSGGGSTPPSGPNVLAATVSAGPAALSGPSVNTLYTSVTICQPGTTTCQTIDNIQVDTGSSGLRLLASALTSVTLPLVMLNGAALVECLPFADGSSWGPLRQADVKIGGESASKLTVQVIGDSGYPNVPSTCQGTPENTVATFGANGLLGVSPFIADCGSGCATATTGDIYYACTSSSTCQLTGVATSAQVLNPVSQFATDNNGVIIQLPSVDASGAANVAGYVIFGIGTQGNNGLGSAAVYTVDASNSLGTTYNGTRLTGFIDSGSNGYFFYNTVNPITVCPSPMDSFFCPSSTANLSATIEGSSGSPSTSINFSIANADTLVQNDPSATALSDLGGPVTSAASFGTGSTQVFDWGLPFFYGRSVYTAIEQHNTSGGMGPYIAF